MKTKILLFTLLFSNAFIAQVQELSTFNSSYFDVTLDVNLSYKTDKDFDLWINASSLDELVKEGGVIIRAKQYSKFTTALDSARIKYIQWDSIAKKNNVKELDKRMNIECKTEAYFNYLKNWEFQFIVPLKFDFKIITDEVETKTLLIIRTGELTSSSNEFIKMDGLVWVFNSVEEIESFQRAISMATIKEFVTKPKTEDLFKN
jgi:hypothetical protein